jgi:YD repeat-containing protein
MRNLLRAGALAWALLTATVATAPALAETPVDQCVDSGSGAGPMPTVGTGLQPEANFLTRPATSAQIGLGTVNPRNGAFVYSNEDIALGEGEFPARLNLVRTYSSDQDGPLGTEVSPNAPYMPGSIQWFAFGRGATHNLDIRFEIGRQSFDGQVYQMVTIRTGFQTETFQACLDGQYKSSRGDGSRLFADTTYGAGGFRYEMPDGTIVLFQKLTVAGTNVYTCGKFYSSSVVCGAARRWLAPNGDWADFEYETYYSHPTNRAESTWRYGYITNWLYNAGVTECYPSFGGSNECHSVVYPNYYSTSAQEYPAILSYPVYEQRLTRVSNSRGYELRFAYVDSTTDAGGYCPDPGYASVGCVTPAKNTTMARNRIQSVTGNWVSPASQTTPIGQVTYGYSNCMGWSADCLSSIQAPDGATTLINWTINQTGTSLSIQLPGETTPSTTVTFANAPHSYYYPDRPRGYYNTNPRLTRNYFRVSTQAFADGSSVSYSPTFADRWVPEPYGMWARTPYAASMQITQPGNAVTVLDYVDQYDEHGGPVSVTDPLNRTTTNSYNAVGALASTTLPEGQRVDYSYDVRGNLLSTTRYPKPGSAAAPLTESSAYTAAPTVDANACANQLICNRPISRTDARNFQTDFAWNSATGLLTSATRPADPSGLRPMTSYTYGTFTGAGTSSIQLLTSRTERIDATHNLVTDYGYGSTVRLPPREVSRTDGTTTQRSCYSFDLIGNMISETQPNATLGSCP